MNPLDGNDVNYRAWLGTIDENFTDPHETPKTFIALNPAHNFYASREWATECSLGVNEEELENPKNIWSVVFRRGEEPVSGQGVIVNSFASYN